MPKATYSRIIATTTDAEFRQWASDLSTALKACLTQTADTGQVDWTLGTQTRPRHQHLPLLRDLPVLRRAAGHQAGLHQGRVRHRQS